MRVRDTTRKEHQTVRLSGNSLEQKSVNCPIFDISRKVVYVICISSARIFPRNRYDFAEQEQGGFRSRIEHGELAADVTRVRVFHLLSSVLRTLANTLSCNTLFYPQVDTCNLLEHVRTYTYDGNAT